MIKTYLGGVMAAAFFGALTAQAQTLPAPTAYYPLDGDVLDYSGNDFGGVNFGASFISPAYASVEAAAFSGAIPTYVVIPKSIGIDGSGFTIAYWLETTDTGGGPNWYSGEGLVDAEMPGVTTDFGTALVQGRFALGVGQPDTTLASTNLINDGHWHHVAATWNMITGAMSIYVDGALNRSVTGPTGPRLAPPNLRIGSIQTGVGGGFFTGVIDEVRLYDSVLTAEQVAALKNLYPLAPEIGPVLASPTNIVYAGATVSLSVAVSGPGPYHYQWQLNGSDLNGVTNALLNLSNATSANSGTYSVAVNNAFGTNTSPPLTLTVHPASAPIFTTQPSPAEAQAYQNGVVTFSAVVDGSPPIALQWQHDGTNLPGRTLSILTLDNLNTNEEGAYLLVASNGLGTSNSAKVILTVLPFPTNDVLNVLTYHNDNMRSGATTNELVLTPANVNSNSFGKLFTQPVDGAVYAQPLYVAGLEIQGKGKHNVVFVATQHGTLYAFDADSNQGPDARPLWQTSFINPANGVTPLQPTDFGGCPNIPYEECIEATPVIDLNVGQIFLEVFTREAVGSTVNYVHRLHAINIGTGAEEPNGPVVIDGSYPGGGDGGSAIVFNPDVHQCRTALLLQNGVLYFGYSSQCDSGDYRGWVMAYNEQTLQPAGVYVNTPNGSQGGIWQGGGGFVGDPAGAVYVMTGNGTFGTNYSTMSQYNLSEAFLKFTSATTNGLTLTDFFVPYNQSSLTGADLDLAAGSPMGLPDSVGSASHPHLLLGCGKDGTIYLLDRDNLGRYNAANDNQIVQELPNVVGIPWSFPVPVYFNNTIYYNGNADVMHAYHIANASIHATPVANSTVTFGSPGGNASVSANGVSNAIVWALQTDAWASSGPAVLHAYNATNLVELYNSGMIPARDSLGAAVKWTVPTVANGKVYVGQDFTLSVFGNGVFLPTPVITPAGTIFTNSITITLSDSNPGATLYYTLDGTDPTTNSAVYSGPITLTNSTPVHAIAAEPGHVNSGMAFDTYYDAATLGTGTGLTGAYYANANQSFNGTPALVRVDPVINFDWGTIGPGPSVGQENFTVEWTGSVQPNFSETYTLYFTADDGVRVWVNGQEVINEWITEGATTYLTHLAMNANQLYNIDIQYFQGCCGANAVLQWSSPSTPLALIPQSQLYSYTNPPPSVTLAGPADGASYAGGSSVTLSAEADAQYNSIQAVNFYANQQWLGAVSHAPYSLTATGLASGSYSVTAVAIDGSALMATSAPISITIRGGVNQAYGIADRTASPAFLNMPTLIAGALPTTLSQTGVFTDTPNLVPAAGLIPYLPNSPLWSDGAVKTRWMAAPYDGGAETFGQQIGFAASGSWTFPAGTVFVKNFDMALNQTNSSIPARRLETRLLVRNADGGVYGVTYKWRNDNSDADLLTNSLSETLFITNAAGVQTQSWYYPSPSDCLQCHTPVANYVLGVNTRQLNGPLAYPSGVTDNQLRTLNHLGLFDPGFDEAGITDFEQLVAVTNQSAPLVNRVRSYIDANCAQCHQPGGPGPSFDARYDTPLTNQNIIYGQVIGNLGVDNAHVVNPQDIWRSMLYQRADSLINGVKMPPLARNTIDTNAMATIAAWINSLPGTPAVPPPTISPVGGVFGGSVVVTMQDLVSNAVLYYTLDGSLPTTASFVYGKAITLTSNAVISANAFAAGYTNSIAVKNEYSIDPIFTGSFLFSQGQFEAQLIGVQGTTYVLQSSSNLVNWTAVSTNTCGAGPFYLTDPTAGPPAAARFYRAIKF